MDSAPLIIAPPTSFVGVVCVTDTDLLARRVGVFGSATGGPLRDRAAARHRLAARTGIGRAGHGDAQIAELARLLRHSTGARPPVQTRPTNPLVPIK